MNISYTPGQNNIISALLDKIQSCLRGVVMLGKILDINNTDAFVAFDDGTTADIGISHLPKGSKTGDKINIDRTPFQITNDKLQNFF